jgi:hypothetical protein
MCNKAAIFIRRVYNKAVLKTSEYDVLLIFIYSPMYTPSGRVTHNIKTKIFTGIKRLITILISLHKKINAKNIKVARIKKLCRLTEAAIKMTPAKSLERESK